MFTYLSKAARFRSCDQSSAIFDRRRRFNFDHAITRDATTATPNRPPLMPNFIYQVLGGGEQAHVYKYTYKTARSGMYG